MAIEKEALTHKIEDDLARRNRNWDKIDTHMTNFNSLQVDFATLNNNIKNNIQSGTGMPDGVTLRLSLNTAYLFINNHGNSNIMGVYILMKAVASSPIVVIPIHDGSSVAYEIIDSYNIKFTAPTGVWTLLTLTKNLSA